MGVTNDPICFGSDLIDISQRHQGSLNAGDEIIHISHHQKADGSTFEYTYAQCPFKVAKRLSTTVQTGMNSQMEKIMEVVCSH